MKWLYRIEQLYFEGRKC